MMRFLPWCAARAAIALLASLLTAACAAPQPKAKSEPDSTTESAPPAYHQPNPGGGHGYGLRPAPPQDQDPMAALAQAEAELQAALRESDFAKPPSQPTTPQATPPDQVSRCDRACRALASMQRAAEHLCELDDGEKRCTDARERVNRATDLVRASCAACASSAKP